MRRSILLSREALETNLRAVREHRPDAVVDVRADAYGHGIEVVAEAAGALGLGIDATGTHAAHELTAAVYGVAAGARPVMEVRGEVVATKRIAAGAGVSYGYTYRVERDTTVALIGLGYADGLPRAASSRARALLGGALRLVAGRIAMDQLMLDLGDDDAAPGDVVTLWGDEPTVADWAEASGTPALALTSGLGQRFERSWSQA